MTDKGERKPLFSVTKDQLEVQTFRSGGPGGQNQNKRDTGVRIIHSRSGAVAESREHRTQLENKKSALKRLAASPKFRFWVRQEVKRLEGEQSIEAKVEADLADPAKVKVERRGAGGVWESWPENENGGPCAVADA